MIRVSFLLLSSSVSSVLQIEQLMNIPGAWLFCFKIRQHRNNKNLFCLHFPVQTVGFAFISPLKVIYATDI